ncbi:MAG: SDR family oxidoreductase [Planctomycetales bacterium]
MRVEPGHKVLITGAASGIGKELAVRFARAECHLLLVDQNEASLNQVAQELREQGCRVETFHCDLSRTDAVERLAADVLHQFGPPHILINNAGIAWYGPVMKMPLEQWDRLLGVNLHAPIRLTLLLLPRMFEYPEAHVVNMCSICGLAASSRLTAYSTSKFGLVGFSEALRGEFGRRGLGVTAVCPGPVRTAIYQHGESGSDHGKIPSPPRWTSTTPAHIAELTFRAVQRDKRLVVVTWLAKLVYWCRSICPGFLDAIQRIGRRRKLRQRYAEFHARQQSSQLAPEEIRRAA